MSKVNCSLFSLGHRPCYGLARHQHLDPFDPLMPLALCAGNGLDGWKTLGLFSLRWDAFSVAFVDPPTVGTVCALSLIGHGRHSHVAPRVHRISSF